MDFLKNCRICPRNCGADRAAGKTGYCGMTSEIKVARSSLHFWEEPCISGESGSGTVFFSGCNLRCVYCQNYKISTELIGKTVSITELAGIFLKLQNEYANNINLVTPTHYTPQIIDAIKIAKKQGLNIPIVYNCGGYESVNTIKMLKSYIDIFLTDFKYYGDKYAIKYSNAPDYFDVAKAALAQMAAQAGKPTFFDNGIMKSGVIVRHLMVPGLLFDSKKIIDYIYSEYGDDVYISIMNQYTPMKQVDKFPEINKKLNPLHYNAIVNYAMDLGITNAYIQDGETAKESFIPFFDGDNN